MSESQFPYQPPDPLGGDDPSPQIAGGGPPRGAMVLMVVLGVLFLALGGCCAGMGILAPMIQLPPETRVQLDTMAKQNGVTVSAMFQMLAVGGFVCLLPALAILILSIFVYRRSLAGTIVALVVVSLMVFGFGLMLPGVLLHAAEAPAGVVMVGAPLALLIWLLVLLGKAIKAAGRYRDELREQQWRLRQSMEQRHRYEQQGGDEGPAQE